MVYYNPQQNWVGCHPLYTLNNQGPFFHCSPEVHDPFPVDFALNQAAKPWVSPIFRSSLVPSVADSFRKCFSGTNLQPCFPIGFLSEASLYLPIMIHFKAILASSLKPSNPAGNSTNVKTKNVEKLCTKIYKHPRNLQQDPRFTDPEKNWSI